MKVQKQQLVRGFVGRKLAEYYAQPADSVVGTSSAVDHSHLSSLWGEWHWRRELRKWYEEREGHWLTPVELFRPHYSNILANFISHQALLMDPENGDYSGARSSPVAPPQIDIVELGGGRGTNANLILSHLRDTQPEVYKVVTYTLVDVSPSLHRLQQEALTASDHADKVQFKLCDLLDVAEQR
jgi:hypothetical protein